MTITTKTLLAANYENYIRKRTIQDFEDQLCYDVAADKGDRIPTHSGDTIKFLKFLNLTRDQTVLTASTQPTAKALYSMQITATAAEYGDRITIERIPDLTAIALNFSDEASRKLANVAARKADYITATELATHSYRVRADWNDTYQLDVTTTSDGNAGGTTLISTSLTQADDFWNGGYATITGVDTAYLSRNSYLETQKISDFANATGTVTVGTAFSSIIKLGCTVHLAVGTGIDSTDLLTTDVFAKCITRLGLNKATRFTGKAGQNLPAGKKQAGYWKVFVDPHTNYEFITDTTWTNLGINQIAEQLLDGSGVKWYATMLYGTTQPWRETTAGAESEASGAVHLVFFCGQSAYAISDVAAPGVKPPFGMEVNYLNARDLGQSVPRNSEMGFILYFVPKVLDSTAILGCMCGAPVI
jgi:N4-gp56 family major capsid protein